MVWSVKVMRSEKWCSNVNARKTSTTYFLVMATAWLPRQHLTSARASTCSGCSWRQNEGTMEVKRGSRE
eukprot:6490576-Amphidinium_carterae.1